MCSVIEHVLRFKLNDDTSPSDAESFVRRLNSLASIQQVLAIAAGPIGRLRPTAAGFTHFLHSRYASEADLAAYAAHPAHVAVVRETAPLVADVLAVDWVAAAAEPRPALRPGSAARVVLLRLKEGLGEGAKREALEVTGGVKEGLVAAEGFSFGENFSPGRAKGISVGFMAVFPTTSDLDSADWVDYEERLKEYLDCSLVVDFVVPN